MFASRRSPVFFGTNSSGKSSLGQILLVLKQTAESTDGSQVLQTGDDDAPAMLGATILRPDPSSRRIAGPRVRDWVATRSAPSRSRMPRILRLCTAARQSPSDCEIFQISPRARESEYAWARLCVQLWRRRGGGWVLGSNGARPSASESISPRIRGLYPGAQSRARLGVAAAESVLRFPR